VAVGDFNGDGKLDLAVANENSHNVSVLLGNGSGGFGPATNFAAGAPFSVAVGDFNGDGKLDLAIANAGSNNVSVLLGASAATSSSLTTTASSPVAYGTSLPLRLGVSNSGNFFNAPTGTVTFFDGASVIGTASQSTSPYTFSIPTLSVGSHTLTAAYSGDTRNSGSTSNILTVVVNPAAATVTLGSLAATYDGNPHSATATTTPPGLSVTFTYNGSPTAPTAAGSYTVVGTISDVTYTGSATGTLMIAKAAATVTLGSLAATYDGAPKSATATTTPPGLTVTFTYDSSPTAPTAAGLYMVVGTINDTNYTGSATGTLVISKATATVTLGSLTATYDGAPHSATATTTPPGLTVTFTYNGIPTAPTTAGSYTVVGTINDTNYAGSATGTLVIAKGVATVTLGSLTATYDGAPHSATATTTPPGLTVTFTYNGSPTAPSAAGSYTVVGTINDVNYSGSATGILTVTPAGTSTTLTSSSPGGAAYGQPITFTATVIPSVATGAVQFMDGASALGNPVQLANGLAAIVTASLIPGTHSITAVYSGNPNYAPSTSGAISQVVSRAISTITLTSNGQPRQSGGQTVYVTILNSPATFTAAVTSDGAGSVQFFDGQASLGTQGLSGGSASLTISSLTTGNHTIIAVYSGDTLFLPSTSAVLIQQIHNTASGSNVNTSLTDNSTGQPINMTSTFQNVATSGITSLTVHSGVPQGDLQVPANYAVSLYFDLSTTAAYSQAMTVCVSYANVSHTNLQNVQILHYNASLNPPQWEPTNSTVDTGSQTVCGAASSLGPFVVAEDKGTTTTVTSSNNPSIYTDAVTFTATVAPTARTGAAVTGSVQFYDGPADSGTALGSPVTLSNGTAQLALNAKALTGGSHIITVAYQPGTYYLTSTGKITQLVNKANQTIGFANPGNHTYGDPQYALTASSDSGLAVTFAATGGCSVSGPQATITAAVACTITASQAGDTNYNAAAPVPQTIQIAKAPLMATPNNANRTYGDPNPTFTGAVTGAVYGDILTPAYSTPATPSSPVGTYDITVTLAGAKLGNYDVTYNKGALTVTAATLTIITDNKEKFFGQPNPTLTGSVTGVRNNETFTVNRSTTANQSSPVGSYPITADVSGSTLGNYRVVNNGATLAVNYLVVTVSVTPGSATVQYSDIETVTAAVTPQAAANGSPAVSGVVFYIGPTGLTSPLDIQSRGTRLGACTPNPLTGACPVSAAMIDTPSVPPAGNFASGAHTVYAVFAINSNFAGPNLAMANLTISPEDARTTYTGALFASTGSATSSTATLTLSATVQDISAADNAEANAGDIRNGKVTFGYWNGTTFIPISACSNLPVGLVTSSDTKTGTATCNWTANIGGDSSVSYTIGTQVTGYYARLDSSEASIVTISKAYPDSFITGGGYMVMTSSSGLVPGAAGTKNNFGFNVKYNRSGTNLQGQMNIIVRNSARVYQIKGNSMTSLATNPNSTGGTATFNGKANIQDITDPANPISIDGNATLQVDMTDTGNINTDTIGTTVLNKAGGLWFSSNWNGTRTVQQALAGGNLSVK
jgi:hypothetical protein